MATFTIDPSYGYVILAATSTFVLGLLHTVNTGKYRKAAAISYPAAYAPSSRTDPEAYRFNCAQRAHANYIENQVPMVGALLIAGLKYPVVSAAMGAVWTLSKYMYMVGYGRGDQEGKGRYRNGGGVLFWLSQLGLIGMAGYTGVGMFMGW